MPFSRDPARLGAWTGRPRMAARARDGGEQEHGVSGKSNQSRNAAGLFASIVLHVLLLGLIINQVPPDYEFAPPQFTPQPPATAPAMDVRIMKLPPSHPKVVEAPPIQPPVPPPAAPQKPPPSPQPEAQPAPIIPAHPKILPPTPSPAPPTPAPPTPPAPAPLAPTPAPTKPTPPKPIPPSPPAALPAPPTPAPAPRPAPNPAAVVNKAPPSPNQLKNAAAPAAAINTPTPLNIHKAAQAAPAGVATLPMAPSTGASGKAGAPATASAAAGSPGSSRLNGLTPYPYGFMPSGGSGLRGTLVGCANAEAVHLSPAERDKCNERFGVDIAGAPKLDAIAPAKRAAFDKAADSQAADRRYRASTTDLNFKPSDPGGIAHGPASTETFKHNAGDPITPGDPH